MVHVIGSRVDGTGTAALLSGSRELTLTDNGTGDYTLTFAVPYKQVPVVVGLPVTAGVVLRIGAVSVSAVQILVFATADGTTATDADFHVMIMGSDVADEV
jgi:hypothetical protein